MSVVTASMLADVQPAARGAGEPASEPSQAGPVEAGATIRYLGHNAGSAELPRRRSRVEMSGCSRRTKWRGVAAMRRGLRQRSMLGHLHKPDAPRRRAMAAWAAGALAGALAAAGCAASGSLATGHTATSGGTVTYALPANSTPNYIVPFTPGHYFTQVNSDNLQYLLYRPLYWFGAKGLPDLNTNLSLAEPLSSNVQVVTSNVKRNYQSTYRALVNA